MADPRVPSADDDVEAKQEEDKHVDRDGGERQPTDVADSKETKK